MFSSVSQLVEPNIGNARHFGLHLIGGQNLIYSIDLVRFDKILEQNIGD